MVHKSKIREMREIKRKRFIDMNLQQLFRNSQNKNFVGAKLTVLEVGTMIHELQSENTEPGQALISHHSRAL
jgi:hypothetical protein